MQELYSPMKAALEGRLMGEGTLGTVILCESLLCYLSSGQRKNQPSKLLTAYHVMPRTEHEKSRRVDLSAYAMTSGEDEVLYVPRPAVEKVWVPLLSLRLSTSARAIAKQIIDFLNVLQDHNGRSGRRGSPHMIAKAADIIVLQFKQDLMDIGAVRDIRRLNGDISDGHVKDVMTAGQYVDRVFIPDNLPEGMSFKTSLSMAMELMNPRDLRDRLATALLRHVKVVPKTTVHARSVVFSMSQYTLLLGGQLSALELTNDDIHRLVIAYVPLLDEHFGRLIFKKERKLVLQCRPCLIRCVRGAIRFVRRKTRSTRHLLAVVCFVTVMLAIAEKLIRRKIKFISLYRATNLSRYIRKRDIETIVRRSRAEEEYGLPECRIILDNFIVRS